MAKSNLPIEVHDHFRKANVLHSYVLKDLGEATKHALETGQELMAAKSAIPHGSWEDDCERLFDGSLRTAQFYMAFAKDMAALPKAHQSALLLLDGTLKGAAQAAREAVRGETPPKRQPPPKVEPEQEPDEEPEPESDAAEDADFIEKPEPTPAPKAPPKKYDRAFWFKQWMQSVGPLCRLVDKIANELGEKKDSWKVVQDHLAVATEEMQEWMGVKK